MQRIAIESKQPSDADQIPVHTHEHPHPVARVGATITDFALRADFHEDLPLSGVPGLAKPNRTQTTARLAEKLDRVSPLQRSAFR